MVAALWGNVDAVDVLLRLGADPNLQNDRREDAVCALCAASEGWRKNALRVSPLMLTPAKKQPLQKRDPQRPDGAALCGRGPGQRGGRRGAAAGGGRRPGHY
jgi:hypothetical protein